MVSIMELKLSVKPLTCSRALSEVWLMLMVTGEELTRRTRKTYAGPLEVGNDLMAIEVGEQVKLLPPAAR